MRTLRHDVDTKLVQALELVQAHLGVVTDKKKVKSLGAFWTVALYREKGDSCCDLVNENTGIRFCMTVSVFHHKKLTTGMCEWGAV